MVASAAMSWVRRGAALLFGLGPLLLAPSSRAESAEQPLRIQYDAHEGCPDALSFFWHVRARTQRVRLAEPGELAVLASVSIARNEAGQSVGTLALPDVQGQPFTRRVEAVSCGEVVLALSLVLALAYDPDAIATFDVPAAAPPEPAPPPPPPTTPVAPPPPRVEVPAEPTVRAAVGVEALLMTSIAPGLRPVFGPFIEVGAAGDSSWWRPRVVATMLVEAPEADVSVTVPGTQVVATATLSFFGGRLAGCPGAYALTKGLEVAPCLGVALGRIAGAGGTGLSPSTNRSDWWAATDVLATLRFDVGGPLFLQALGGVGFTLYRPTFTLHTGGGAAREDTFYSVPPGFAEFGIALGAHFP
jgi:hypothetical protein